MPRIAGFFGNPINQKHLTYVIRGRRNEGKRGRRRRRHRLPRRCRRLVISNLGEEGMKEGEGGEGDPVDYRGRGGESRFAVAAGSWSWLLIFDSRCGTGSWRKNEGRKNEGCGEGGEGDAADCRGRGGESRFAVAAGSWSWLLAFDSRCGAGSWRKNGGCGCGC